MMHAQAGGLGTSALYRYVTYTYLSKFVITEIVVVVCPEFSLRSALGSKAMDE